VSKRWIDLTEALNHHQGWGESTRTRVRDEIDRVGGVQFRTNVHGVWNSIQVFNGSGEIVADLMKTQVRYTPESAPPEAEDRDSKDGWRVVSLDGVRRHRLRAHCPARATPRADVPPVFHRPCRR
jgi:hypothetical protein